MKTAFKSYLLILSLVSFLMISCDKKEVKKDNLKSALTFYSSFDKGIDADFALGDKSMYTVMNRKERDSAKIGLHKPDITRQEGKGKYGAGLVFTERSPGYIYYPSEKNVSYNLENWNGAISFWLSLDPAVDLKPGYCDPIQITDEGYNDAGIWVDFTKENPRDFRLGVIEDRDAWNPNPVGPDNENPIFIDLLPVVRNPPFAKGKWTHVLINFKGLNTQSGSASIYLDGEFQGSRLNIKDPFTWEISNSNIYLGLSYIGLMDDLSIFNRSLSNEEIKQLYQLENGVQSILSE